MESDEFDVSQFIDTWLLDVRQKLERTLEIARYDLLDGDQTDQKKAAEKANVILGQLSPPPPSAEARHEMAEAIKRNKSLTATEKIEQVDAILHPKRKRGRPKTETIQNAIHALSLYRKGKSTIGVIGKGKPLTEQRFGATGRMNWREIALKVIGCKHSGRTTTKSCISCGEAIERAVSRLKRTLEEIDELPVKVRLPRTLKELDKEIEHMYRTSKKIRRVP